MSGTLPDLSPGPHTCNRPGNAVECHRDASVSMGVSADDQEALKQPGEIVKALTGKAD